MKKVLKTKPLPIFDGRLSIDGIQPSRQSAIAQGQPPSATLATLAPGVGMCGGLGKIGNRQSAIGNEVGRPG
jgi:hypothetical protein